MKTSSWLARKILKVSPWLLKLLLSGLLICYLFSKIESGNVIKHALALPISSIIGAFALIFLQGVLAGIRWSLVVLALGLKLKMAKAISITFVSLFFNQFLPASVGGDLVRMWQSNKAGLPASTAITSVMLERIGSLLAAVSLSLVMLPAIVRYPGGESIQGGGIPNGDLRYDCTRNAYIS